MTELSLIPYSGPMRSVQLAEFKKDCLAILEEVERTGETVTILRQDRPVARLAPPVLKREE
ncbi:MAG TPA: type II toxin-antitoxin system Phd/YefM family antitoxin, partial [Thermoanaerobaculia bacterium]